MHAALNRVAVEALGLEKPALLEARRKLPGQYAGSLIPVFSEEVSTQIGLVSDAAGCELLTRALLGMMPDEEVGADDIPDGIGEIVNMMAGGVKSELDGTLHGIKLGLPVFVNGHIETGENLVSEVSSLKLGDAVVDLFVLKHG
jgi:CheY-specific phosphatase CheX